ncbi:MAG TPA: cell division protein BolA [Sedimenticola thiotaurini]|uniref:Cell division protein BolA n=1 Tax=Sedimenticola thiotaurini TaxID=1543721 RepID=A0A831RJN6_9GAMM|nr:cell division protein BolA [Sedimenticola thiotaurini]
MTVCARIKGFARHHERIADLFSLLAVALLFGSIWVGIFYQNDLFEWMGRNVILHGSAVVLAIVADVFLIILLLSIGSSRFEGEGEGGCFQTFRGRRHGGSSLGTAFRNWIDHIENVNKKHR